MAPELAATYNSKGSLSMGAARTGGSDNCLLKSSKAALAALLQAKVSAFFISWYSEVYAGWLLLKVTLGKGVAGSFLAFAECPWHSAYRAIPVVLLGATEGADVSFIVKHEVFSAHKIILAMCSAVFWAEFYGPMTDEQRCSVTVEDMQPDAFRGLLHFIYKDSLPRMGDLNNDEYEEILRHLLVDADRYAMERRKLMCESKLCEVLSAETVGTTLALAHQRHCSQLKDACIEFIMNSSNRMVDVVVASKGYETLKRECPTVIADIWEKTAKRRRL
ncbi:BTB/POZ and MATH domain-containing protein 2-like [Triticum urartu]|uniref:BTB/POZ and MATH domain-containing protein 2-like n=1 Tax=Triticum urartu TaxID=4572 RepID=UPI002042CB7B|nr:BTB/POZ and MATH domain-containing protein 2-like [Triticum urartu]